jgi:hypothetical protein
VETLQIPPDQEVLMDGMLITVGSWRGRHIDLYGAIFLYIQSDKYPVRAGKRTIVQGT